MTDLSGLTIARLSPDTWDAFAALVERHNGIFGGCWCTYFTSTERDPERTYESNRELKRRLVHDGKNHAALVMDGDEAVGWAEYGPPCELPNIHHRKQYDAEKAADPDWRITCIFVDRRYRRSGVAKLALQGALDLIAASGGGIVEGYPQFVGEAATPIIKDATSFKPAAWAWLKNYFKTEHKVTID